MAVAVQRADGGPPMVAFDTSTLEWRIVKTIGGPAWDRFGECTREDAVSKTARCGSAVL